MKQSMEFATSDNLKKRAANLRMSQILSDFKNIISYGKPLERTDMLEIMDICPLNGRFSRFSDTSSAYDTARRAGESATDANMQPKTVKSLSENCDIRKFATKAANKDPLRTLQVPT